MRKAKDNKSNNTKREFQQKHGKFDDLHYEQSLYG